MESSWLDSSKPFNASPKELESLLPVELRDLDVLDKLCDKMDTVERVINSVVYKLGELQKQLEALRY